MRKASNANSLIPPLPADSAAQPARDKKGSLSLWLWVAAGYIFLSILWTVMFKVAATANVQSVPLATQGAKP